MMLAFNTLEIYVLLSNKLIVSNIKLSLNITAMGSNTIFLESNGSINY